MKASEVATQLALALPQLTDQVTNEIPVASVSRSGTLLTVLCNKSHGLAAGDLVALAGAEHQHTITSLTRTDPATGDAEGTLVTDLAHDLVFRPAGQRDTVSQNPTTIEIRGAADSEYNGTFDIVAVDNRKTIRFTMPDAGPLSTTGGVLIDAESDLRDYNQSYQVLGTPNVSTFTVAHSESTMLDPLGTIVARTKPRIGHAVTIERAIEAYTKQTGVWLFVVLEDVFASKSRAIRSDATDNLGFSNEYRQQLIQPFTIYAFVPVRDSRSGSTGRDEAEDIFRPICRSILMKQFDSGLATGATQGAAQFVSHGTFRYDTATYIHAFSFQQVVDLIFEDTVGPAEDVAFRNIDLTIFPDFDLDADTGVSFLRNSAIDLDDIPL
jgi:hypothetical protein